MTVVRSLSDYFKTLNTLLGAESWRMAEEAAKFFSIKGAHTQCKFLQIETAAVERRPQIDSVFDDLACLHLMVLHALSKNKFAHAFSTQAQVHQQVTT
ncbi:PCI domain-containing protein 2 -like protein [Toxocara canis]|uniref:PCI domain-containing protein 2-like protein n=1 Tax=Toxocara canis TaxID=6265 RepID=A0A0B2UUK8_TOXCA|nr:PCI domain-containing protein 2 -like protein [Toxocara canis]